MAVNAKGNLASQFVHWRGFGFGEMARGTLPLWNPHIDSGAPFLAGSSRRFFIL